MPRAPPLAIRFFALVPSVHAPYGTANPQIHATNNHHVFSRGIQTMHATQKRYLSMFRRVHELLSSETANPTIVGPLTELDGIIVRMTEHGVTQDSLQRRTRSFTVNIGDAARSIRRDLMRPAMLAARTVYPVVGNGAVALRTVMRMPRSASDYELLVVTAHAFANAVDEHTQAFATAGLPKEHASRLRAAAEDFVKRIDTRSKEEQRRIAATRGLGAESQRGVAIVRLLDALVEPTLRSDPARLVEWRKATRIRSFVSGGSAPSAPEEPTVITSPSAGDTPAKVAA